MLLSELVNRRVTQAIQTLGRLYSEGLASI